MLQIPQQVVNRYIQGSPAAPSASFPINLADKVSLDTQKQILIWMSQKYIWPQIQERVPFENNWNRLLEIARITMPGEELFSNTQQDNTRAKQEADQSNRDKARVADATVHDAIERLTDITRFVAFKEALPVQFTVPDYIQRPNETKEYRPLENLVMGGNALLLWNSANNNLSRNSTIAYRHHYTYGCAFVKSDYKFRIENIARQANDGSVVPNPEITEIGTTFEPISIRKIWLNWRLPVYDMESQPCPFYYEETPRFAIMQNVYDPMANPFGYVNLNHVFQDQYLYNEQAFQAVRAGLSITYSTMDEKSLPGNRLAQILQPKHSVEAKWTFFPMLPFDAQTGEFDKRADGTQIPYKRFVVESFGPNVHSGSQILLRLQEIYYPKKKLPLYASVHMPDLDSGAYAPAIGQILYNHYREITLCHEQFLQNKDWINDPPAWIQSGSPSLTSDLTQKGAKLIVNGPNDFGWRQPYDATASTVAMIQMLKEDAKTTSKAVDAILGKAMGGRTTATEANNVYQAAMSGITADIDLLTADLHGAYARRVWDYSGLWMDKDLLKAITGQLGFEFTPQDMWINLNLNTQAGSTYIEKSARQQNLRYILESGKMDPILNRAELWKELLESMGFDAGKIVDDGGHEQQIQFATLQACETYLGLPIIIDPDQDHQTAMKVKTGFLKDKTSVWNTQYGQNAPMLVTQIQQHQYFLQMQMQMMLAQQQAQIAEQQQQQLGAGGGSPSLRPPALTGGQAASQAGGKL
jgi:hypothetical protein